MNQSAPPATSPVAKPPSTVTKLLIQIGDVILSSATAKDYDAVVGIGSVPPQHGRNRFHFQLSDQPSEIKHWGSLCVLYFPNAEQIDVCGQNKAAAELYFELRTLAEYDGGFEVAFLRPE